MAGHGLNGTIATGTLSYTPFYYYGLNAGNFGLTLPVGTLDNLSVRINSSQPASGNLVATVYVNGVASAFTLTIPANSVAGLYSNVSTTLAISANAAIVIGIRNNAGSASALIGGVALNFEFTTR